MLLGAADGEHSRSRPQAETKSAEDGAGLEVRRSVDITRHNVRQAEASSEATDPLPLSRRHPRVAVSPPSRAASPSAAAILAEVTATIEGGDKALHFLVGGHTRLPASSTDLAGARALQALVAQFDMRCPSTGDAQLRRAQAQRLLGLLDVYRNNTPAGIFQNDVERTALTLQALLELDIDPDQLESAVSQAYVRDMFRQLLSSGAGYTLSWFLGNLTAYQLQKDHPEVSATARVLIASAVIGLGARVARRFIAGAEWAPVWTSAVMTDKGGRVRPFSQTHRGAAMSSAAYAAFMVSLLAISLGTADPQATHDPSQSAQRAMDRQRYRMFWNFLATGGVGCWRFFSIPEREYPFLSAKDRPGDRPGVRREVLQASVRHLTQDSMFKAAAAYTVWDPLRGVFELPARTAYRWIKHWALGGIADASSAPDWLRQSARHHLAASQGARDAKATERNKAGEENASRQGRKVSSFFKDVNAAISLTGVAAMASFIRSMASDYPHQSTAINCVADGALVFAWGVAMHAAELSSAENPSIASEASFRAQRRTLEMAPTRADALPTSVAAVALRPPRASGAASTGAAPSTSQREPAADRGAVVDASSSEDDAGALHA